MIKVIALAVLGLLIIASVLLGRKIEPYELEQEVMPGVKPYIPSEEIAIFGTRRTRVEEILRHDNPEYLPLQDTANPEADDALAEGDSLRAAGQLEGARASYQRADLLLPNDISILLRLAEVQEHLGDVDGAVEIYSQVLEINSEIADASEALERLHRNKQRN